MQNTVYKFANFIQNRLLESYFLLDVKCSSNKNKKVYYTSKCMIIDRMPHAGAKCILSECC